MEVNPKLREKIILGVLVILLVTGGVWRSMQNSPSPGGELVQAGISEDAQDVKEPELITVHLVGAVKNPGVYHLPVGSRVYELLDLCGGFSADADQESLNQARPLFDGEQIFILNVGELPVESSGGAVSAKININQASVSDLTTLPGIGEVRAGQIVAHREKYGLFSDPRELMDVGGIGEKTFENLADLITIY